jgi:hypothetical protein
LFFAEWRTSGSNPLIAVQEEFSGFSFYNEAFGRLLSQGAASNTAASKKH